MKPKHWVEWGKWGWDSIYPNRHKWRDISVPVDWNKNFEFLRERCTIGSTAISSHLFLSAEEFKNDTV